ncbi:hypothetical protein O6H91_07G114100 [Diphasiastrum complanatum]|uniref:Uncharacterized protein n=1 Tax=Diphasiastrum complanatum TaxID=34168 RepID=A0ACC2D931_DIPCM|nr:hypothetical protein O6H91_07G114100 [Diphasiastrum complanatum]
MGQCSAKQDSLDSNSWNSSSSSSLSSNPSCRSRTKRLDSSRRIYALMKEQRSRFYILRRCIVMLLCWHKYGKD